MPIALRPLKQRRLVFHLNIERIYKDYGRRLARVDTATKNRVADELIRADLKARKNRRLDLAFGMIEREPNFSQSQHAVFFGYTLRGNKSDFVVGILAPRFGCP